MLSGTPPLLGILAVREGAAVIAEAGIGAIRRKAVALTEMVVSLTDEWLVPQGFSLGSPRDSGAARRPRQHQPAGRQAGLRAADRGRRARRFPHPAHDPHRAVAAAHRLSPRSGTRSTRSGELTRLTDADRKPCPAPPAPPSCPRTGRAPRDR